MSTEVAGPLSPTPSLIEVRAETRFVLKSFLRKALSLPAADRPGRVGGEYYDSNKFSALVKENKKKKESGWDSLDEQISAAEEKKHGIKNLIKRRLKPRPHKKDNNTDHSHHSVQQNGTLERKSGQEKGVPSKNGSATIKSLKECEKSSASEGEADRKMDEKKKKKSKMKLPGFRKKSTKKEEVRVPPATLPIDKNQEPVQPIHSPSHPPEFYDGVAHTLDKIAQRSVRRKSPVKPIEPKAHDKEAVVQALVQVLTTEGDTINEKINANPLLRASLNRLSYASFAKLLDTCASETVEPPLPAPVSPTLRHVAITMEMTRRVVTATGVPQRVEGYAERYMENFVPWVKSHGGWESIVQMEAPEYD